MLGDQIPKKKKTQQQQQHRSSNEIKCNVNQSINVY